MTNYLPTHLEVALQTPVLANFILLSLVSLYFLYFSSVFYKGRQKGVTIALRNGTGKRVIYKLIVGKYSQNQVSNEYGTKYSVSTYVPPSRTKFYFWFGVIIFVILLLLPFLNISSVS